MIPQASLFLGVIPGMLILFIGLKGFQGLYKEKNIFLTFAVGIILGIIAAFIQSLTVFNITFLDLAVLSLVYIVLLGFINQLLKTMMLNIGRLQEKRETPLYGLSLGLGFGCAFTPMIILAVDRLITTDAVVQGILVVGTYGIIVFHGATGVLIGYGIYLGKLWKYLIPAILFETGFDFILGITIMYSRPDALHIQMICVFVVCVFAAMLFWFALRRILPRILDEQMRRKRTKKTCN